MFSHNAKNAKPSFNALPAGVPKHSSWASCTPLAGCEAQWQVVSAARSLRPTHWYAQWMTMTRCANVSIGLQVRRCDSVGEAEPAPCLPLHGGEASSILFDLFFWWQWSRKKCERVQLVNDMLRSYGSSSPLACPLTCPELFRRGMALHSVVVSREAAGSKVDASDAGCHGSVSCCVAGFVVKGRACFMLFWLTLRMCGVPFQVSPCYLVVTILGAGSCGR